MILQTSICADCSGFVSIASVLRFHSDARVQISSRLWFLLAVAELTQQLLDQAETALLLQQQLQDSADQTLSFMGAAAQLRASASMSREEEPAGSPTGHSSVMSATADKIGGPVQPLKGHSSAASAAADEHVELADSPMGHSSAVLATADSMGAQNTDPSGQTADLADTGRPPPADAESQILPEYSEAEVSAAATNKSGGGSEAHGPEVDNSYVEPLARLPASEESEADEAVHSSTTFEPTRQPVGATPLEHLDLDMAATQPPRVDAEEIMQAVDAWPHLPDASMVWEERADDLSAEVMSSCLQILMLSWELLLLGVTTHAETRVQSSKLAEAMREVTGLREHGGAAGKKLASSGPAAGGSFGLRA